MSAENSGKTLHDRTTSIEKFLEAAAAKQPTPGGGSVTALTGALAAAMGGMVLNYSLGKKGEEHQAAEIGGGVAEFHRASQIMVKLMEEDQSAYEELATARKLPANSPQRAAAVAAAATVCARVPETMAATGVAILGLADQFVDQANRHLLSDLAVCAELAMAATRAALYNVRVNLPDISDADQRRTIEKTSEELLGRAVKMILRVMPRIRERMSRRS
jgi:methenyltetrahydrofolate cyclohydrolase